jgi:curved DNA-binding protein CbpA
VLGLARGASKEEIGSTYRKLARQYHPDKLPKDMSQVDRDSATNHFTKIAEANDMLSRPERRAEYDDLLQNPEMKELIPRCVACLVMMGYWLIHLIIDVNDFENQRDENKNRLRTHVLNGQPLNWVALGITDPEQLRDYCRNEDCDLPMLAKNDLKDVVAFRELLKESGFALEKMPEEMEMDPLTQLIPQTKAAEVKSGLQAPSNVVPNKRYGPGGAKTDAKRVRTKMAQQKGYVKRVKDKAGGCTVM